MKTKLHLVLFLAATATLFYSCNQNTPNPDRQAELDARKQAFVQVFSMFETGNTDGLENYVNKNIVEHTVMPGITETGIAGLKQAIAMNRAAYSDIKMTMLSIAHEGDLSYVHYNWKGTNTGPLGEGMPATGKKVDVNGVDIVRFEGVKAAEHWGYSEDAKMMEQLGMGMGMPTDKDSDSMQ